MANVAKLLYATSDEESYLENLRAEQKGLRDARREIRERLREAFTAAGKARFGVNIRPRFFTQGSFAYRTLNSPAWPPEQQRDLDDGCYLPLSFVRGEKPSKAAEMFFAFVDEVLIDLAREKGWRHVPKPTCARVVIERDAHVDIPLYAIPDGEFRLLEERALMRKDGRRVFAAADTWQALPSDAVLLAHRDEDWKISDPRKVKDWFLGAVDVHGERLRRDSRYLKGWRDHHRLDGARLTSILLMAAIYIVYEEMPTAFIEEREDKRLLSVVQRLPPILQRAVSIPTIPKEDLNRMSDDEKARVVAALEDLRLTLEETISRCNDADRAVCLMTDAFGTRMPQRPDLVSIFSASVTVRSIPAKTMPAPEVGRSRSG